MQALKALVIVLGVLLVGGAGLVIGVIVDRLGQGASGSAAPAHGLVALPAGARVLGADIAGDRVMVRIGLAEGGEALILVDAKSGAPLGRIELKPAGAGGDKR